MIISDFELVDIPNYFNIKIIPIPFKCHIYYEYLWKVKNEINLTNADKIQIANKSKEDYIIYVNSFKNKKNFEQITILLDNLKLNNSLLHLQQQAILLHHLNLNKNKYA